MNRASPSLRVAALWGLLGLAAGILFAAAALPTIAPSSDLWEYAQEARQIARGEGFTSLYTYPVFLGREGPPYPVLWRMPLYPALGALLLQLGVPLPAGFLHLGALAHALLVGLTYWLGARLHSSRAGSIAAACAVACPLFLDAHNPGLSQTHAAALGLAVWALLLSSRGRVGAALSALPAAAAWYLRAESMIFVPVWLWTAALPEQDGPRPGRDGRPRVSRPLGDAKPGASRPGRAIAFLAVYAALCIPWVVAAPEARTGFSLPSRLMLLYSPEYPGYSSWRMIGAALPGPIAHFLERPGYVAFRYARDVFGYGLELLASLGPVGLGLAIAGLAVRRPRFRIDLRSPTVLLAIAILLQILVLSAIQRAPRFLVPVVPLVCVFAGLAGMPVLELWGSRRGVAALVLALLLERSGTVAFQRADALRRAPPLSEATVALLAERMRPWPRAAALLTDVPDWAAWHLDRPAIFLPMWTDVERVTRTHAVSGIWLAPDARGRNAADRDTAWVRAIDHAAAPQGFSGPEIFPDGSKLYTRIAIPPG